MNSEVKELSEEVLSKDCQSLRGPSFREVHGCHYRVPDKAWDLRHKASCQTYSNHTSDPWELFRNQPLYI